MTTEQLTLLVAAGISAIAALAGVWVAQRGQSTRDAETRKHTLELAALADRRAERDAKLARLRKAFKPVILASWTLHTAGQEFFVSAGDPRATSKAIMDSLSIDQVNDARAELMLERDVRDVFDELQGMYTAFNRMRLTIDRPDLSLSTDLATLDDARAKIEKLVGDHLRAVEQSVT